MDETALEEQRDRRRRETGRVSFDCFHLKEKPDCERVYCAKGHLLGQAKDGTLALVSVLRGVLSGACKNCNDFEGGD